MPEVDRQAPELPTSACARCGERFVCGAEAGQSSCWCAGLPPLAPVPGRGCLCRACLTRELASKQGAAVMPFSIWWEDFQPGQVFEHGARSLSEEEIIRFARDWDPQRYHVDPQAARDTPFGGLIASGWQSCALAMRLMCDAYLRESSCVGSPGIDEIRFLKPVRPGDTLRFRSTVLESNPSRSKQDRGTVSFRWELLNQKDEVVLSMVGKQFYLRRALP